MEKNTTTIKSDDYKFTISLKNGKEIILNYNEATIWETLEFLEIIESQDFSIVEYIYDFIITFGDTEISKDEFKENVMESFPSFLEKIKVSRFNGVFQESDGSEKKQTKTEVDPKYTFEIFRDNLGKLLSFLSLKMSRDPKYIGENYTWNEANYWLDWYLYWNREETEEGRTENRSLETAKDISRNKQSYDNQFAKLDLYLKKQTGKKS